MHLIGIYLSLERLFICSFDLFPDKNRRYARIFENGFSQTWFAVSLLSTSLHVFGSSSF